MTVNHRRYLATEAGIGAAINAVLSVLFFLLVFGGWTIIPARGLALDALPQSFMVALMSVLVPTWLARRRVRAGLVPRLQTRGRGRGLAVRALAIAGGTVLVGGELHWPLLPRLTPPDWRFAAALGCKAAYGALLGPTLTALAVRRALAD